MTLICIQHYFSWWLRQSWPWTCRFSQCLSFFQGFVEVHPSGLSWILLFSVISVLKGRSSLGCGRQWRYSRLGIQKRDGIVLGDWDGSSEEFDSGHHRHQRHCHHFTELQHEDSCPPLEREREDCAFSEKRWEDEVTLVALGWFGPNNSWHTNG